MAKLAVERGSRLNPQKKLLNLPIDAIQFYVNVPTVGLIGDHLILSMYKMYHIPLLLLVVLDSKT